MSLPEFDRVDCLIYRRLQQHILRLLDLPRKLQESRPLLRLLLQRVVDALDSLGQFRREDSKGVVEDAPEILIDRRLYAFHELHLQTCAVPRIFHQDDSLGNLLLGSFPFLAALDEDFADAASRSAVFVRGVGKMVGSLPAQLESREDRMGIHCSDLLLCESYQRPSVATRRTSFRAISVRVVASWIAD